MNHKGSHSVQQARLRRGRTGDLDALVALETEFFGSDHAISRRSFRRFISSPNSTLIVADVGGEVAGCALVNYRRTSARARLYTIAVAPKFQRRGIARQLLAAAEQDAQRRGRRSMRLEVREDDNGAIALYESSGYSRFGRRRYYYDGHIDALLLEKPLDADLPGRQQVRQDYADSGPRIGFDGGQRSRGSRQLSRFRV